MRRLISRILGSPLWSALIALLIVAVSAVIALHSKTAGTEGVRLPGLGLALGFLVLASVYQFVTRKWLNGLASLGLIVVVAYVGLMTGFVVNRVLVSRQPWTWREIRADLPEGLGSLTVYHRRPYPPSFMPVPGGEQACKITIRTKGRPDVTYDLGIVGGIGFDVDLIKTAKRRVVHLMAYQLNLYHDLRSGRELDYFSGTVVPVGRIVREGFVPAPAPRPKAVGGLFWPVAVALDTAGNVYVADMGNDLIAEYTSEGRFIRKWPVACEYPQTQVSIAVSSKGVVWVMDWGGRILRGYGPDGEKIRSPTSDVFDSAWGLACDTQGSLYVTQRTGQANVVSASGKVTARWGSNANRGAWRGGFDPAGIAVSPSGEVFIANRNKGVEVYDREGNLIRRWRTRQRSLFGRGYPVDVKLDTDGNVYAAVWHEEKLHIEKYTSDGRFVLDWSPEIGLTENGPVSIAAGQGCVYVADEKNHRVLKYSDQGKRIPNWGL